MKKFIISVLCISVFFIGLGNLVEKVGATFKSDEKALEAIRKARIAIGGDAAISGVRSMTILGKTTKTFEGEGITRSEQCATEINFELPNKMSRMMKIGSGESGNQIVDKKIDVVVVTKGDGDDLQWKTQSNEPTPGDGVKKIIVRKSDGTTEEIKSTDAEPIVVMKKSDGNSSTWTTENGKTINVDGNQVFIRKTEANGGEKFRTNELFRTSLSLLLSAPEGLDVSYTYVGEGNVDGYSCDIISASDGGPGIKLYLDKATSLPRMMTYQAPKPFIVKFSKMDEPGSSSDVKVFTRTTEAPEMAEFQVKFSDFRSVNGVQLPYKWTQTVGGKDDELTDITSYEINPANIADKFKETPTKVFVRTTKEQ